MAAVTSSGTATVTLPNDEQILITREFDAPKHLVYKAWTTPELVKRWWSGNRGEMTITEIDLRVDGVWQYVMVTDDGFEVAFHGEYREIVPNERIVSTEVYEGMPEGEALNTLTLTETDGRTTLKLLMQHTSKEARDAHINSGMETGMQEGMDLLEQIAISGAERSRGFKAPHEEVGSETRNTCSSEEHQHVPSKGEAVMANDNTNDAQAYGPPPEPSPALKSLDRLVGTWEVAGDYVEGTSTFEWMEGGYFLLQRYDFERQDGQKVEGIEVIGHERPFGAEPSEDIKSRAYSNTGDTLDYVYELEGDTLTIWGGEKDSPAYYRGTFSADGGTLAGRWHWPGGGYEATSTRVE